MLRLKPSSLLYPLGCRFCSAATGHHHEICPGCEAALPWITHGCKTCGLPVSPPATHCSECLQQPTGFSQAIIPLRYEIPVSSLITHFKYRSQLADGRLLAGLMRRALHHHYSSNGNWPSVIMPVPLHHGRQLWRGYNQAAELARFLAREFNLPCDETVLRRQRPTPRQQALGRQARLANLHQAFGVIGQLNGQRIALLDDVVTTGATAIEIGKLLKAAGAGEIHLWAIARTPSEQHDRYNVPP